MRKLVKVTRVIDGNVKLLYDELRNQVLVETSGVDSVEENDMRLMFCISGTTCRMSQDVTDLGQGKWVLNSFIFSKDHVGARG
jgi:hypothetical protein